ncbi:transposase [Rathayibacter toxicus]|nr:transposase [Rathayibacter toxicus]PPG46803.1 transposase [Rathayibacter toxicus]PPH63686.1 transposase [Rathayibacter toxicus]PPH68031.1 transposase [Rathayibacter toxicus]PPH72832.1 transposase [Rathayibacter toxicus]
MRYGSTIGVNPEQLTELVSRIWQIVSGRSGMSGRPVRLTIREQVVATLIVVRHTVNQATIADMFGVSQPTISRVYRRVVPLIEQACCLSGVALDTAIHGTVVLVDCTDVPTGNRAVAGRYNYSGKRHRQGLNVQIASDLDGLLLCVSDPVPGAQHDRAAITLCGWEPLLYRTEWRADPASTSTSTATPRKKPISAQHDDNTRAANRYISSARSAVERYIAH